jgi:hypothetical protein
MSLAQSSLSRTQAKLTHGPQPGQHDVINDSELSSCSKVMAGRHYPSARQPIVSAFPESHPLP